jgi:hypothetical protein
VWVARSNCCITARRGKARQGARSSPRTRPPPRRRPAAPQSRPSRAPPQKTAARPPAPPPRPPPRPRPRRQTSPTLAAPWRRASRRRSCCRPFQASCCSELPLLLHLTVAVVAVVVLPLQLRAAPSSCPERPRCFRHQQPRSCFALAALPTAPPPACPTSERRLSNQLWLAVAAAARGSRPPPWPAPTAARPTPRPGSPGAAGGPTAPPRPPSPGAAAPPRPRRPAGAAPSPAGT